MGVSGRAVCARAIGGGGWNTRCSLSSAIGARHAGRAEVDAALARSARQEYARGQKGQSVDALRARARARGV